MKNVMLAGVLTAMMLTSAATAAVPCAQGINNANNADSAGSVITVTSSAKASRKSTAVKLSRLSDCTVIYPEYAKVAAHPTLLSSRRIAPYRESLSYMMEKHFMSLQDIRSR